MATIHVVLDAKLLKAANTAAKRGNVSRSALIRKALEDHLKKLKVLELEEQERRAYLAQPQLPDEYLGWESIAAWPDD
jgi:metal-responsive CopG/Arc/MetJ family transcriptional regulator